MRVRSFHVFVCLLFCSCTWLCRWCGLFVCMTGNACQNVSVTRQTCKLSVQSCCISLLHRDYWTTTLIYYFTVPPSTRGDCVLLFIVFVYFYAACGPDFDVDAVVGHWVCFFGNALQDENMRSITMSDAQVDGTAVIVTITAVVVQLLI